MYNASLKFGACAIGGWLIKPISLVPEASHHLAFSSAKACIIRGPWTLGKYLKYKCERVNGGRNHLRVRGAGLWLEGCWLPGMTDSIWVCACLLTNHWVQLLSGKHIKLWLYWAACVRFIKCWSAGASDSTMWKKSWNVIGISGKHMF